MQTFPFLADRRRFLTQTSLGLGAAALATLLRSDGSSFLRGAEGLAGGVHFRPRAKRVILLTQSGAPSQIDLFDAKPGLKDRQGEELPASIRRGQRLTTMTANQDRKPIAASEFRFARHGESGAQISELLPYTAGIADELCIIRSLHTEAINHDPGVTCLQTGVEQPGRPSIGAWVDYALGSENADLPAYAVFVSGGQPGDQPLYSRLWGAAFMPTQYQGVRFRGDGLLYLDNPPGVARQDRSRMIEAIAALNQIASQSNGDPGIVAQTRQYEMTERMQQAAPEAFDLSQESAATLEMYGPDASQRGTYAANCLLARRLLERDVRFVQLFHRGWDHHSKLSSRIREKCQQTDQPSAALVRDLRQRGLLEDTLVVWAGEFGRTVYSQGDLQADSYGRDHHPRCFSIWLAGGGVKPGVTWGTTDDFSYNIVDGGVSIHDLQATILHCLGLDHERLTYRHQGRDFRLTDISGSAQRQLLID
ncbi:DUF1501 domain-containing protein [Lignipirellula cremea]|uniref:Sulfatase n=1 Tax=Lignipirellula cremea TaxID=2528010 RepID=A0A518DW70_9BACT|nr:DUF1501 domain-containing protein [Lignipirellula cremea]QDU96080.1 hypothetical protein Pla8534_38990 [Lignipirellula cremea]